MQFTRVSMSSPINFGEPGPAASADIVVDDTTVYQQIDGIGASMSKQYFDVMAPCSHISPADSSALILNNLKASTEMATIALSVMILTSFQGTNTNNYWKLLNYMFDTTYAANSAGLSYIRVPIGASDFSESGPCSIMFGVSI